MHGPNRGCAPYVYQDPFSACPGLHYVSCATPLHTLLWPVSYGQGGISWTLFPPSLDGCCPPYVHPVFRFVPNETAAWYPGTFTALGPPPTGHSPLFAAPRQPPLVATLSLALPRPHATNNPTIGMTPQLQTIDKVCSSSCHIGLHLIACRWMGSTIMSSTHGRICWAGRACSCGLSYYSVCHTWAN